MLKTARKYIRQLGIKVASANQKTDYLSSGNKQKVMLAKWFNTSSKIFIMDEPTVGIDTASKVDVYNIMNELIRNKAGILFISSNIQELTGMCDRILVMHEGRIVKELSTSRAAVDEVLYYTSSYR